MTATCPSPKRLIRNEPSISVIRAAPCEPSVSDGDLPALPGAGVDAHRLQDDGEQAGRHLFSGSDDGVVFARVVHGEGLARPGDEFVGLAGHGRDDHGHVMSGVDLAFDVTGHIADSIDVGDGRSAEFHHDARHGKRVPRSTVLGSASLGMVCPGAVLAPTPMRGLHYPKHRG